MENVNASPTKRFFVSMLTRDIELRDAILDLLDNCIDGILRTRSEVADLERPYAGYWAKIIATPGKFAITDNCGGIPKSIAPKKVHLDLAASTRHETRICLPLECTVLE
jgi:hypothetical protein